MGNKTALGGQKTENETPHLHGSAQQIYGSCEDEILVTPRDLLTTSVASTRTPSHFHVGSNVVFSRISSAVLLSREIRSSFRHSSNAFERRSDFATASATDSRRFFLRRRQCLRLAAATSVAHCFLRLRRRARRRLRRGAPPANACAPSGGTCSGDDRAATTKTPPATTTGSIRKGKTVRVVETYVALDYS